MSTQVDEVHEQSLKNPDAFWGDAAAALTSPDSWVEIESDASFRTFVPEEGFETSTLRPSPVRSRSNNAVVIAP